MVSFHSLNTLITADVKCLPGKSNIWVPSGTISIGHFFPMSKPYFSVFCASYNILWKSSNSRNQATLEIRSTPLSQALLLLLYFVVVVMAVSLFSYFSGHVL